MEKNYKKYFLEKNNEIIEETREENEILEENQIKIDKPENISQRIN